MKTVGGLAIIGFGVAFIGGMVGIDSWFRLGALIFSGGILVVGLVALWRRPSEAIESTLADGPTEYGDEFSIQRAEEKLASKNRGTIPTSNKTAVK